MYLKRILIQNFKNIINCELNFNSKINCLCGDNGVGKTNLLDAIFYLSTTKSYFSSSDSYTYNYESDSVAINGIYIFPDKFTDNISVGLKRGVEKIVKKNGKQYSRISEHIGQYPIVMVSPFDTNLINESGDERRKFINLILSQIDRDYLVKIQKYNHLLTHRNKLLKDYPVNIELLDTISYQMAPLANYIFTKRDNLSGILADKTTHFYRILSGGKEVVGLQYLSDLKKCDLLQLFDDNKQKDYILKYTSSGVQRDDIVFSMNDFPIKKCGSQGQQKCFLIALKLAKYDIIKEFCGKQPILLLDDVFDKLDLQRVDNLLKLVSENNFGQIFISDSNKIRLDAIINSRSDSSKIFMVNNGNFTELNSNEAREL